MRYVLFDTTLFGDRDDVKDTRRDLNWLLEALVQRNMGYLKQRPDTPRLYRSGVRYQLPQQMNGMIDEVRVLREAIGPRANRGDVARALATVQEALGGERFRDIGRVIENGGGDCDNLAAWRAAELRQAGIPASVFMTHRTNLLGGTTYHAVVLWPPLKGIAEVDGVPQSTSEDPSLLLGMGGEKRIVDRAEENRKNTERSEYLAGKTVKRDLKGALDSLFGAPSGAARAPSAGQRPVDLAVADFMKRVA